MQFHLSHFLFKEVDVVLIVFCILCPICMNETCNQSYVCFLQIDQDYNSYMLEDLGVSVNLEISQLTTDKLVASFNKLVNKE